MIIDTEAAIMRNSSQIVQDWKYYLSVLFQTRKVLIPETCLLRLEAMMEIQENLDFKEEIHFHIRKMASIHHEIDTKLSFYLSRAADYVKIFGLLRKPHSLAFNSAREYDPRIKGCDAHYVYKTNLFLKSWKTNTSIFVFLGHNYDQHLYYCRNRYQKILDTIVTLMSSSDLGAIDNIFDSVASDVMRRFLIYTNRTDHQTLGIISDNLASYLYLIDNEKLSMYNFMSEFESVYEDEIRGPCERLCKLTFPIMKYQLEFLGFVTRNPGRIHYMDNLMRWDKYQFCCSIYHNVPRILMRLVKLQFAYRTWLNTFPMY